MLHIWYYSPFKLEIVNYTNGKFTGYFTHQVKNITVKINLDFKTILDTIYSDDIPTQKDDDMFPTYIHFKVITPCYEKYLPDWKINRSINYNENYSMIPLATFIILILP